MARKRVGNLEAGLSLDDRGFKQSMTKAAQNLQRNSVKMNRNLASIERSFNSMRSSLSKTIAKSLRFGAIMGTVAGGTGLGLLVKRNVEAADAIAKTADKIGVTTAELQELRFAAERSGVTVKGLDDGLQRFSRRLGEAQNGTGELVKIIKQYGIELTDAAGRQRTSVEVLRDFAEVIKNTKDPTERLRIAFKAFDKEGVGLVNLLKGGADGMEELQQRARDLGIVVEDNLLRQAETANDRFLELSKTIKSNVMRSILQASPLIIDLSEKMIDFTGKLDSYINSVERIITRLGRVWDIVKRINEIWEKTPMGYASAKVRGGIWGAIMGERDTRTPGQLGIGNPAAYTPNINAPGRAAIWSPDDMPSGEDDVDKMAQRQAERDAMLVQKYENEFKIAQQHYTDFERMVDNHHNILEQMESDKAARLLAIDRAEKDKKLSNMQMLAGATGGFLNIIASMTTKKNKALFFAMKGIEAAQATIAALRASAQALPNIPLSKFILGIGLAKAAAILATGITGGASAGGGGGGSYSAPSPTTSGITDTAETPGTKGTYNIYIGEHLAGNKEFAKILAEEINALVQDYEVKLISTRSLEAEGLA